ncbi:hypothetical protein PHYSODRAFT_322170 [Phytophthora sojae]|uniref:Uncharacterized protein n=1 Tax=Phytophthora sojae (strain P6497) TaxID=1094619 RepID=G4YIT4_PHYSP|nr:hypothetical protein PHYSODRAFT_322170 [Phytophthora sojae]EGZ28504.1 hypothetical protein PHYSODRAFT_322170 [Phytophthora sojae]|eukprot:XP_009515779.1 hypothetical protein PHYSODRAFT_322170 [Phytophthora sojae]
MHKQQQQRQRLQAQARHAAASRIQVNCKDYVSTDVSADSIDDDRLTDTCVAACNDVLQRVFRGWRARRRVVHQVRDDMELLVADIRRQLDGAWALLGPAAAASAFALDWGDDGKLRLPRMEDSLFGVSVRFPPEPEEHAEDSSSSSGDEEVKRSCEQGAVIGPPSPQPIAPLEAAHEDPQEGEVVGHQTLVQDGGEEDGISSEGSERDDGASAVEIRGGALQAETSASDVREELERQVENMDRAPLQRGQDGNSSQLAIVQEILATHSREEIVLELQWARQALRDRRKYLRSKKRIEQNPEPLACA